MITTGIVQPAAGDWSAIGLLVFLVSLYSLVSLMAIGAFKAPLFLVVSVLTIWVYQAIAYGTLIQMDQAYLEAFVLNSVIDSVLIVVFDAILLGLFSPEFRARLSKIV